MHNRMTAGGLTILVALISLCLVVCGCGKKQTAADHMEKARVLLREKNVADAKAEIDDAISSEPDNTSVYAWAIRVYESAKLYKDAAITGEMMIKKSKSNQLDLPISGTGLRELYTQIADDYQQAHDIASAERTLKEALDATPNDPTLLNDLAFFYADQGIKLDDALSMANKVAKMAPNNPGVLDTLGWVQFKRGDLPAAETTLKRAVKLASGVAVVHYHLGAVYAKSGQQADAREELSKALLLDSHLSEAAALLKKLGSNE